jgi:TonB-dependent receptor
MKLHRLLSFLSAIVLTCFAPAWAQTGTVAGRVTEAGSGNALPSASVHVAGTTVGTITDADGRFVLGGIPAGQQRLVVSYIGFLESTTTVRVGATRAEVEIQLQPTVVRGEETVITGLRGRATALALTQQKNAADIRNVIASDQIGRFPDASAPDALQRVPGVHVVRDQGEGRYVQIRGGSPAMTSVTFNGERVPSSEGDVRQILLDSVPTEILEAMEVSKAITPDMDADAIGGSVNLVTKRPPEARLLAVEMSGGYGQLREDTSGKMAVTFGDRFDDGRIGLMLSATSSDRSFGSDDLEPEWDFGDDGGLADDELVEMQVRHYTLTRLRRGVTGIVDYELSPQSRVYVNAVFTELQDDEVRRRLIHVVEDDEFELTLKDRLEVESSWNYTLGGDHLLGAGRLDWHATVTQSGEDTDKDNEITFKGDASFDVDISNPEKPQTNPGAGSLDPSNFEFDEIEPASSITENRDIVLAANYSLPVAFGSTTGRVKAGMKFRAKDKNQDITEEAWELADGDLVLGDGIGQPFDLGDYNPGSYSYPSLFPTPKEVSSFVSTRRASLDGEVALDSNAEDFDATENTIALYGMTELNLNPKLMLLAGLRVERTDAEGTGYKYDDEAETLTEQTGSSDYTKLFPMVHARYRLTDNTNLRAAVTTAMLRPNFYDLAPWLVIEDDDGDIVGERGNPELGPATSVNLDLMVEHYIQPLGVVSAGLFYKSISDPIFVFETTDMVTIDGNLVEAELDQPRNGESAWVQGIELAYQQQLRFLPGPLDGLGLYANYTITSSEAELADGRKADLAGQADQVGNIAVSYEKGPFSGQMSLNYHSEFVDEFGGDVGGDVYEDVYVASHSQIDLSATYRVTKNVSASLELLNLTNEPWVLYQTHEDRPIQREYYESWGWLGLKLNF